MNARGEADVWLNPALSYKFTLTDRYGTLIWTKDNVPGSAAAIPAAQYFGVDSGAANAYVVTLSGFVGTFTPSTGTVVEFYATNANTGASTLNVNSSGAAAILSQYGISLSGGEIQTIAPTWAQWNGSAWQIMTGISPALVRSAAEIAAGVTPVNYAYAPSPVGDARRYCVLVLDSSTDNTTAISGMWTALATYRGPVTIPYGCKFNKATVYSTMPVGVILDDESSVNTGQPPGYKNKTRRFVTNNSVSDDSWNGNIDGHHAAMVLNNTGTAGTSSATNRLRSIIRAAGFRWNNDEIDNMQWVTQVSGRGTLWRTADVLLTNCNFTFNYTTHWTALTVYGAGAKVNTTDGNCWLTVAGGTSASTEPTNPSQNPAWQGQGYISGTTLTVTSTSLGAAAIGQEHRPTTKPDADNVAKLLDALNKIVWADDAQIVALHVFKHYSDRPRIEIAITPLNVLTAP
jgi:hypothetical protein